MRLLVTSFLLLLSSVVSLIHHLTIKNDNRHIFKIETFGFLGGGELDITVSDFSINHYDSTVANKMGFLMKKSETESSAEQEFEKSVEFNRCMLDNLGGDDIFIDMSSIHESIDYKAMGLYSLLFVRCVPEGQHHNANFKLDAVFYNRGPNYLSAGDAPLPSMYFTIFLLFAVALGLWSYVLFRDATKFGVVQNIHYMMLALLVVKCVSLLVESIRFHYIAIYGESEGWSMIYYFISCLKGVMLFTVILLIGSGWSLVKSYLNDREKKIIFIVLILQVLDNIAMVILQETAPGSQGWLAWRDILHLIDIICCISILLPIVWSINHLRQAGEVDGKAHNNMMKLQMFRQFYISVVIFIYFTRIIVFLIEATIPFYLLWLGPLTTEFVTLIFYVLTGYKFRPALDNPYLAVRTEDLESNEYGLDDDDGGVEMPKATRR